MKKTMKRGQMQSMETIIIVIILIFLILLGVVFFASSSKDSVDRSAREVQQQRAATLSKKLHYLPELSCPNYGAEKTPCIDVIKLELMSDLLNPPLPTYEPELLLSYHALFGDSYVEVVVMYPPSAQDRFVLYNNTGSKEVSTSSVPIAIFDPVTKEKMLGLMYAEMN